MAPELDKKRITKNRYFLNKIFKKTVFDFKDDDALYDYITENFALEKLTYLDIAIYYEYRIEKEIHRLICSVCSVRANDYYDVDDFIDACEEEKGLKYPNGRRVPTSDLEMYYTKRKSE